MPAPAGDASSLQEPRSWVDLPDTATPDQVRAALGTRTGAEDLEGSLVAAQQQSQEREAAGVSDRSTHMTLGPSTVRDNRIP